MRAASEDFPDLPTNNRHIVRRWRGGPQSGSLLICSDSASALIGRLTLLNRALITNTYDNNYPMLGMLWTKGGV
jgi:hypothetical protein